MLLQRDILTHAVINMELDVIADMLPDDICISSTSKCNVLQKAEEIFSVFQLYQNTTLEIVWLENEGNASFSLVLVGGFSGHYLPISVMMYSELEIDIHLIYDERLYAHLDLDKHDMVEMVFFKDEAIDFVPTQRYLRENENCQVLLQDMKALEGYELDLSLLESWIDEATETYEQLTPYKLQFRGCFMVYKYYNILWEFKELMEFESAIADALEMYGEIMKRQAVNGSKKDAIVHWLKEQSWLYEETITLKRYRYLIREGVRLVKVIALYDLYINADELVRAIEFLDLYEDVHASLDGCC